MTTTIDGRRAQAAQRVAMLTLLWFLCVPPLVVWAVFSSLSLSDTTNPNAGAGAVGFLVGGLLTVLLPLLAGVIALRGGRPVLGGVYLVVTVLMLVPGGALTAGAGQTLGWWSDTSDAPAPRAPGGCQEHSGGDTRCPGG